LCFRHGPFGKPHLDGGVPLSFSMTHSRNLVSVAMTHGADQYIGIDIEHDSPHIVEIALDVATPGERAALQTLTPPLRRAALLRLWVQKESLLKAEGSGFASAADQPNGSPLHTVELPVGTNTPMTPLRLPRSFPDVDSWSVHTFEPASNVAGAMAICAASSEIVWHGPLDVRGVLARF
jgi:4'-phosphopantetheinyl transferase